MKDMFLSEYLAQQVYSNTAVYNKIQQPKSLFKPFSKPVIEIIPDLNFLTSYIVSGVQRIDAEHEFYMIIDESSEPKLLIRNKEDDDEIYESMFFKSFLCFSECVDDDVSDYSQNYFLGLISLCICSVKINDQYKQSLLSFTDEALSLENLPSPNYWEFNCQTLLMLIKQHKLTDFDFQ
tara:strand:+ start:16374 stop:16910 length:537 start_codon:yes stop_codon:yes gene_type:complete